MGIEAYVVVFARVWDLLGGSSQPPYWTGDETKDLRLQELRDALRWFQMWHEYNLVRACHLNPNPDPNPNPAPRPYP